jgi:predicted transcriptional regulator
MNERTRLNQFPKAIRRAAYDHVIGMKLKEERVNKLMWLTQSSRNAHISRQRVSMYEKGTQSCDLSKLIDYCRLNGFNYAKVINNALDTPEEELVRYAEQCEKDADEAKAKKDARMNAFAGSEDSDEED